MHQCLPQPENLSALLQEVERHSSELAAILTQAPSVAEGEELALLRGVEANVRELIVILHDRQLKGMEYLSGFARNTLLCIGAHRTRYFEDLAALALTNFRLYQLATGKIAIGA